ncbi:uncharacterized protein LOC113763533 [Coffea eugenioides]|uniref:Uncharacterized protein n=1 Tax=Coffea arabica TaxID=13443 RepID=A0A6P6VB11_COFAR|nr:uncharacterized protein LOC113718451 [Coffea arabica]XP_027163170.1 uncharacterized protein LOC113763533 [Coffea eugenioides]
MEGVTATAYKGVKGYWMRKGYEKLDGSGSRRRKRRVVELGAENGSSRRRRFWRIRLTPRLKLKLRLRFSPKKFILGLRDAYVNLMTKLASSRFVNSGVAGYPGEGISGFGLRPLKEYDEKMIVEIYKSLVMAQGHQLVNPGVAVAVARRKIPTLPTVTEC